MLPGADPEHDLHHVNTTHQEGRGPLLVSKTFQGVDPPWLRLAYMPYPLTLTNLIELLDGYGTPEGPEKRAVRLLRAQSAGVPTTAMARLEVAVSFQGQATNGGDVLSLWAKYQHLAMCVAWAWGVPREQQPSALFFYMVADEVARIYDRAHWTQLQRLRPSVIPANNTVEAGKPYPLGKIQDRYRETGSSLWDYASGPDSLVRIMGGLHDTIRTAGTELLQCPNCRRIFQKHDSRQMYCSKYCKSIFHRRRHLSQWEGENKI